MFGCDMFTQYRTVGCCIMLYTSYFDFVSAGFSTNALSRLRGAYTRGKRIAGQYAKCLARNGHDPKHSPTASAPDCTRGRIASFKLSVWNRPHVIKTG